MQTQTKSRAYREGKCSRRRVYQCRKCGDKFQVDAVEPLPEDSRICPGCKGEKQVEQETSLVKLSKARQALVEAKSVTEIKEIMDIAASVHQLARKKRREMELKGNIGEAKAYKKLQDEATSVKIASERGAGDMLGEIDKNPGAATQLHDVTALPPTLEELGISRIQSHRWQLEAIVPEDILAEHTKELINEDKEPTSAGLVEIGKPIKAMNDLPPEMREQATKRAKELERKGTARYRKKHTVADKAKCIMDAVREAKRAQKAKEISQHFEEMPTGNKHLVYCKSSEDMSEVLSETAHLIVTSPPYNNNARYDGYDDNLPAEEYEKLLSSVLAESYRILVEGGRLAWVVPAILGDKSMSVLLIPKLFGDNGFTIREIIVWQKSENQIPEGTAWGSWCSPSNPHLRAVTEYIIIGHKETWELKGENPNITPDEFRNWTQNLWIIPPSSNPDHPTVFPSALVERLIKLYSFPNQTVVDPFCGSGTTAESCIENKRNFIGYDVSRQYCNLTKARCLICNQ